MRYDISKPSAPKMPNLGKGTECIKILLSQASRDMREPLVPMAIPALAAHLSEVEFMYCENQYYELCGQMGHLIGSSGIGKAQFTHLVEAICRDFRRHDEAELKKLVEWLKQVKSKASTKEKPATPLWQQLQATGYEPTCKTFTPRQVRAIVEQLGEP